MKKKGLSDIPKEYAFNKGGPASKWRRIIAFIIDLLVVDFVLFFPFRGILTKIMPTASFKETYSYLQSNPSISKTINIIMLFFGILTLLYFAILEWKLGQTIGKIFTRITVASQTNKLRFWQCAVRSLFLIPVFPFVLLSVIDPILMFLTKTNQRLSEILSKTMVVNKYN